MPDDQRSALAIRYLVSIDDPAKIDQWISDVGALHPQIVVREPTIAVVVLESPFEHSSGQNALDRHSIIDDDLDRIRAIAPAIGGSYPELNGNPIGNRWPVVLYLEPSQPAGPAHATAEVGWDNLLIRQASDELAEHMVRITAVTLGRYRILVGGIRVCREVLGELRSAGPDQPIPDDAIDGFLGARQNMIVSRVLTDARTDLYWGCEQRLLHDLYVAWGMSEVERAADDAVGATSAIWNERSTHLAQLRGAQQAASARRTAAALLILTLFGGVSALSSLIEFSGSNTALTWARVSRVLLSLCLLVALAVLLVLNRQSLRRAGAKASP